MSDENPNSIASKRRKCESINIIKHVSERLSELKKLYNDINTRKSEMLIHQLLPNHIRRRAMSHNPKRLPRRYRDAHINQMKKSGLENKPKKRPSRKYRRKPSNLMKEYNRRKQRNVWLETHIWHAKRFKMMNLWGYKVPYCSTNKRFRASYKAIKSHCMVQDISYHPCIEITGEQAVLIDRFSKITSKECGLTLTAKCYLKGTREGQIYIFKKDSYPYKAIAPVSFLWQQSEGTKKTIWMFVHPSAYNELLKELIDLFEAKSDQVLKSTLTRNPRYTNTSLDVHILELKDTLNRFRLHGPFSTSVLTKTFTIADYSYDSWFKNHVENNPSYKESHDEQNKIWEQLKISKSTFEYQTNGVLGLTIADPRSNRTSAQQKAVRIDAYNCGNYMLNVPKAASDSLIWSKSLRDDIFKTKITNNQLNKLRNEKQLIPSVAESFERCLQPIPIILIQHGNNRDGITIFEGWDVIVPAGYGLSTWLALIKNGAKVVAGVEESNLVMNEMKIDMFQPDSSMGAKEFERIRLNETQKYFRKPPNKRTNYRKFKIASPFSFPLKELVAEWNDGSQNFFVLRNKGLLKDLSNSFCFGSSFDFNKVDKNAVIPVFMSKEGNYRMSKNCDYGLICLPKVRDIKRSLELDYTKSREAVSEETPGEDDNENSRKTLRFQHKKLLKRLRNRRIRAKRRLQAVSEKLVRIQKSQTKDIIDKYFAEMCELWLPNKSLSVRNQCSREVIGYISKSYFRYTDGKVCAIGYITVCGLEALLKTFHKFKTLKIFALTRATNSRNYFKAHFNVNF